MSSATQPTPQLDVQAAPAPRRSIDVVIPAYNESDRISAVVTSAGRFVPVLVVDDGDFAGQLLQRYFSLWVTRESQSIELSNNDAVFWTVQCNDTPVSQLQRCFNTFGKPLLAIGPNAHAINDNVKVVFFRFL